jgi:hypothetical protein
MRYVFGFMCVCALGVMPIVGCSDTQPECNGEFGRCDDGDDNECRYGRCLGVCTPTTSESSAYWVENGTPCESDGIPGLCIDGVCVENLCEGVVCEDDGNLCTDDTCDYVDGTCVPTVCEDDGNECTDPSCDPTTGCYFTAVEDGRECNDAPSGHHAGMCEAGVCVDPCDPAYEQESQCPIKGREAYFCCPGWVRCLSRC